jgi:hypothetical protein
MNFGDFTAQSAAGPLLLYVRVAGSGGKKIKKIIIFSQTFFRTHVAYCRRRSSISSGVKSFRFMV